jgi:acetyl-CoA carboxylase biotin carboxyl carrier protein
MSLDEIKELLDLFNASGVGELEVERKDIRIKISRASAARDYVVTAPAQPVMTQMPAAPAVVATAVSETVAAAAVPVKSPETDPNTILVKSPIVGTYYESPSPGAASFVKVGDSVETGQVLCIIESMKLMNEIEAEIAGIITGKLVENGKPVEYGEALFSIRPR